MKKIEYRLQSDYIMEEPELVELIRKTSEKYKVILLVAPQGTGKSYYFEKESIDEPNIILSPTRALANQYLTKSKDNFGDVLYYANTFTGAKKMSELEIEKAKYLVIDEIHKAVQYSSFAYSQTDAIMDGCRLFYESGKPIILVTATPELLYCLEGYPIYDNIEAIIEITNNCDYLESVHVLPSYKRMVRVSKVTLVKFTYNISNRSAF